MRRFVDIFASLLALFVVQVATADWSYDREASNGPDHWSELYQNCGGQSQSPVDLVNEVPKTFPAFQFTNYDRISPIRPFTLTNNGHSAQVSVAQLSKDVTVSGGGLRGAYTLEQLHFHWGKDDTAGSEHLVSWTSHPMEIHLVHYDASLYANVSMAVGSGDKEGLAVLGVFVDVNAGTSNAELEAVASRLKDVPFNGDKVIINAFSLLNLLPQTNLQDYYRYAGSLTTPGCSEVVVWTVFTKPLSIDSLTLDEFRLLHENVAGEPDVPLEFNYRPVQPINARTIYLSSP